MYCIPLMVQLIFGGLNINNKQCFTFTFMYLDLALPLIMLYNACSKISRRSFFSNFLFFFCLHLSLSIKFYPGTFKLRKCWTCLFLGMSSNQKHKLLFSKNYGRKMYYFLSTERVSLRFSSVILKFRQRTYNEFGLHVITMRITNKTSFIQDE